MLVIGGIGLLITNDPTSGRGPMGAVEDAALIVDGQGRIAWYGEASELPEQAGDDMIDIDGRAVVPGFVDSHSHLVFAGDRVAEFAARMAGRAYSAGGIGTTVAATRAATDEMLLANARRLCDEALSSGTTTIEIKTGYGLTVADEARCARVAATCTEEVTFLGAHVVPKEYADRADDYVALVCGPMLDACAPPARWIDVFCERGAFDADQARAVLRAGRERGLVPKIHANQLGPGPGVQVGVELGAASCDHCTHLDDADIDALAGSGTVATLVPGADFSTRSLYPDARRLLDAGATVALATDCNPGTSYTTSMPFVIALAVRELHMSCDEAVWSATMGGARALARADVGHLSVGASADLIVLDAPSHEHLAYRPGVPLVHAVFRQGLRRR